MKIHGARVDLTETELALQDVPGVRQAAVVMRERSPGDPRAVAYVAAASAPGPSVEEMRRRLRPPARLHDAGRLRDAAHLAVDSGRQARPPRAARADWSGAAPFVAPRTPVEELLASMWSEVLSVERVGVDDAFLELGGDSLTALRLVTAIRDRLQLDVPPARLLAAATVADMAVEVAAALAERLPAATRDRLLES